jgi:broad specificity phosphatase PhoE
MFSRINDEGKYSPENSRSLASQGFGRDGQKESPISCRVDYPDCRTFISMVESTGAKANGKPKTGTGYTNEKHASAKVGRNRFRGGGHDVMEQKWPYTLWIVRHGQSAGNIARIEAEAAGLHTIDITMRDVDVPLSPLGERQAEALGQWFGKMPRNVNPTVILCSPYLRAKQTVRIVMDIAGLSENVTSLITDERLREKEFGILDRLTMHGIREKYPELSEQRDHVGKFYFRPPGGESWCDVILRLRSTIDTIIREYRRERVLIVSHQVILNCFRYLLERMDEQQILSIDSVDDVPNCGVNSYEFDSTLGRHGKLVPRLINFVLPLQDAGAQVTREPDVQTAPKS